MKITSVNAALFRNDETDIVNTYEKELDMTVKHMTVFGADLAPLSAMFTLGNNSGATIDVIQFTGEDVNGMRVNVDHFEDGFAAFKRLGYKTVNGPALADSKFTALLTKEGCAPVLLVQHISK